MSCGRLFDHDQCFTDLQRLIEVGLGDEGASVTFSFDESFGLQKDDGLPGDCTAYTKYLRQGLFTELGPWLQRVLQDGIGEGQRNYARATVPRLPRVIGPCPRDCYRSIDSSSSYHGVVLGCLHGRRSCFHCGTWPQNAADYFALYQ